MTDDKEKINIDFLDPLRRGPSVIWNAEMMSRCIHGYSAMSKYERDWFDTQIRDEDSVRDLFEQVFDDDILLDPSYRTESPLIQKMSMGIQIRCATGLALQIDQSTALITEAGPMWIGQSALIKSVGWSLRILEVQTGLRLPCALLSEQFSSELKVCSVPLADKEDSVHTDRPVWYIWSAAATIVVMIMAGMWWLQKPTEVLTTDTKLDISKDTLVVPQRNFTEQPQVELPLRQVPKPNKEKLLAAHFEPNAVLENFIGRTYRAEVRIEIIQPSSGDTLRGPLVFTWKKSDPNVNVTVNILNNRNASIWEANTKEDQLSYNGVLAPGLYYWIIKSGDVRLDVRKFYIPIQ